MSCNCGLYHWFGANAKVPELDPKLVRSRERPSVFSMESIFIFKCYITTVHSN